MKFHLFIHDQSDDNKLTSSQEIKGTQEQILHESQELTKTYIRRRVKTQCQRRKLEFSPELLSFESSGIHPADPVFTTTVRGSYFTGEFNSMQRMRITLVKLEG